MTTKKISPADFDSYRSEIRGCFCADHCLPILYLTSLDSGRHNGGEEHTKKATALLEALRGGTHVRRSELEYAKARPSNGKGYTKCVL